MTPLIERWEAEVRVLGAERFPAIQDTPVHLLSPSLPRDVNVPTLELIQPTACPCRVQLVGTRISEETRGSAQFPILGKDRAINPLGTSGGMPIDVSTREALYESS